MQNYLFVYISFVMYFRITQTSFACDIGNRKKIKDWKFILIYFSILGTNFSIAREHKTSSKDFLYVSGKFG